MDNARVVCRRALEVPELKRQQRVDETLDRFRHAVVGQSLADHAPLGREMRGVGQFHACGDRSGVEGGRGKVRVQGLGRVELGDRQGPEGGERAVCTTNMLCYEWV